MLALDTGMKSFLEWVEFYHPGGLEVPSEPSFRGGSRLTPDPMVGKEFGMVLKPSTLSAIRSFGTDSGGLPRTVQYVLDSMEDGALIMSNEDMAAFKDLAAKMGASGGFMKAAADDILRSLEGAVEEAMGGRFRHGEAR